MSRRVGVDLSSTRAALASVRETRRGLQLRGFAVLDAEGATRAIADDLKQARRTHRFPRGAEVVAWPGDRRVGAVSDAGFRVERVITPGEALARVARLHYRARPASGVTAVVSLHLTSGAVAVVRDGHLLFETQVGWSVAATLSGADSELLRRYTFVSELTESLRRVFEMVRTRQGVEITEILTCGSLADLRSLTMPLAAEFDVEVETLDSTDDIEIRVRDASPQQMRDTIASLRVAIAAGKRWHKRGVKELFPAVRIPATSLATRAALIVALGVLAVFLWIRYDRPGMSVPGSSAARANRAPAGASATAPPRATTERRAGAVTAERVPPAKPLLSARPLRVNARLQRVPRGLQHTALLLALAKAEQDLATSRVAARDRLVSPPAAAAQPAAKPAARVAAPGVPASPAASKLSTRIAMAPSVAAPRPASKAPERVASAPAVAAPPSTATKPARVAPPARVAAAPPIPTPPAHAAAAAPVAAPLATRPPARVPTAASPSSPPQTARADHNPIPAAAASAAESTAEAPARVPLTIPSAAGGSPAGTAWSASAAAVTRLPNRAAEPITRMARPAAAPVVASRNFLPAPADVVVSSILWSSDRKLAIVNSRIVGAGDSVGRHTVVEIQSDAVVFRDRAGRLHRAGLRQGLPESQ